MEIKKIKTNFFGIKFFIEEQNKEVARAFLYIMKNDLHLGPFGLMEDVFVDKLFRGKGFGRILVKEIIGEAKKQNCYKLICTSRYSNEKVHNLYEKLGFKNQGIEFRMNFSQ